MTSASIASPEAVTAEMCETTAASSPSTMKCTGTFRNFG